MNTTPANTEAPLYFSYHLDDGIQLHDCPKEARARAQQAQDDAEFNAADSDWFWTDNEGDICWGLVLGRVIWEDREPTQEEKETNPEWESVRMIEWRDEPQPDAVEALAIVRALAEWSLESEADNKESLRQVINRARTMFATSEITDTP